MGDRAVIGFKECKTGIYVHWNGNPVSVLGFLKAAKELGYRDPMYDPTYAMARLCGLIAFEFGVGDSTSLGVGDLNELDCDNGDNGMYVVGKDWEVVEWKYSGNESLPFKDEIVRAAEITAARIVKRVREVRKL